jgi:hypothetical protein
MPQSSSAVALDEIGLHAPALLAGFAGGVCYVAVLSGRPSIWTAGTSLVVATLTANYLSEIAARYIGTVTLPSAFITGLCATWVCKAIIRKAQSWTPGSGSPPEPPK